MKEDKINEFQRAMPHLANERTFLSWIRTSITIMGFGFVVEKFGLFMVKITEFITTVGKSKRTAAEVQHFSTRVGIILIGVGVLIAMFSFIKYKITEKQICNQTLFRSHVLDTLITLTIIGIGVLITIHLLYTSV